MKLLPIIAFTIFAFATSNPVDNENYRLELPSRSGRRVSTEHEPTSLLRKSREVDFKNALFNSLDESGLDTTTYKNSDEKRNSKLSKRKRGKGRKGKGKKGRKGKKGKKGKGRKGKGRKRKSRKNKSRKNKNRKHKKGGRRKKNRVHRGKKPEPVEKSQFFNNLYNYAINSPNEHDSASFDEQRKDAQTRKYWMRQSRRSLNGASKTKEDEEDSYDSDLLDDYAEIGNMQREIRASTSIDDLFDSKYDMNCLAWDPLTGRCINSRRSGCFGDSSDDGGLMGC